MGLGELLNLVGFSRHRINYKEKFISTLGGFIGVFAILIIGHLILDPEVAVLIVPSMGASAVLLFAAPHAPFSQPWNVIGGHLISAVVGVACWKIIPDYTLAAAASVGLAIGIMYLARCVHPPGGATALAAVIGGESIHNLGYAYVYEPILFNTIIIFLVAIAFNSFFEWRRYPAFLSFKKKITASEPAGYQPINHEDFVYALSQIDTFIDVTEEDLLEIYKLATNRKADRNKLS